MRAGPLSVLFTTVTLASSPVLSTWQVLSKYWLNPRTNVFPHCLLHSRHVPCTYFSISFPPQVSCLPFGVPCIPNPSFENVPQPCEIIYPQRLRDPPFKETCICLVHCRKLPTSLMTSNGGISGPYVPVLTCTCVYLEVLSSPLRSVQEGDPNPPATRKLGHVNNSYALLYTGDRGTGKLISFARKGL